MLEQGRADVAMTLVSAPMDIRGYGPVKEKAVAEVKQKVADLLR